MSEVVIVGAGMVGLALANVLSQNKIPVTLIEAREPALDFSVDDTTKTQRVSALGLHARDLLQSLNVWDAIRPKLLTPFSKIEAWAHETGQAITFNANDAGKKQLGYIAENREIVRVLWESAVNHPLVTIECPKILDSLEVLQSEYAVVVAADGANSWVRRAAGIDAKARSYGQKAIVATIQSAKPHEYIAYQSFLKTGPLGILPLSDPYHLSIVWSADDEYADHLLAMDDTAFNRALSNALDLRLGKLSLLTPRHIFPLTKRHAMHYVIPGLALVGDAAHTIHPLAGQGVNLGFKDVVELAKQLKNATERGKSLGDFSVLRKYERARKFDNHRMQAAMYLFRAHAADIAWGFGLVDKLPCVKRCLVSVL